MIKYKLGATIPTVQYGNIMPEIELEGEDMGELKRQATEHIEELWKQYGERPLTNNSSGGKEVDSFTGETLMYDEQSHSYYDMDGNKLLSGSYYADQQSAPFNKEFVLPKTAKAWGIKESDISEIWGMKGDISTSYGNAIHYALEMYHKHKASGEKISEAKKDDVNYVLPNIPHIKQAVEEFEASFGVDALTEVLISDVGNKMAGRIDRLSILDKEKKVCRIGDFKTNYELDKKKLLKYQHQLSYYAHILINKGWTVEGLDIYHYADKWELINLDVLDLEPFK